MYGNGRYLKPSTYQCSKFHTLFQGEEIGIVSEVVGGWVGGGGGGGGGINKAPLKSPPKPQAVNIIRPDGPYDYHLHVPSAHTLSKPHTFSP